MEVIEAGVDWNVIMFIQNFVQVYELADKQEEGKHISML
jgi:hypothetical protein